jgi:hypothetical protein
MATYPREVLEKTPESVKIRSEARAPQTDPRVGVFVPVPVPVGRRSAKGEGAPARHRR